MSPTAQTNGSLKSSEQAIQALTSENFKLKLDLHNANEKLKTSENNFRELFIRNHELTKELEVLRQRKHHQPKEKDAKETADAKGEDKSNADAKDVTNLTQFAKEPAKETRDCGTMTDLDRLNVEKLVRASVQLKRMMEDEHLRPPQRNQEFHQFEDRRQVRSSKPMLPDEKTILEDLYRTNGLLTAARDILRAKEPSFLS